MSPGAYALQSGPFAVAHRGGAGLATEHTLSAFARSAGLGVRCLETDVRVTRDGHLVCFHDETLHRVAGSRARVRDTDLWTAMDRPAPGRVSPRRSRSTFLP
jgi:glycerophosphoryl diester phosphodiesterase